MVAMKEKLKRTQLYISKEDHEKLKNYSIADNKTISGEVREAVKQFIVKKESMNKSVNKKKDSLFSIIGMCTDGDMGKPAKKDYKEYIYDLPLEDGNK